jgi:plasmid stabilization system protein ParE
VTGANTAAKIVREIGEACTLLHDHPSSGRSRSERRPSLRYNIIGGDALTGVLLWGGDILDALQIGVFRVSKSARRAQADDCVGCRIGQ